MEYWKQEDFLCKTHKRFLTAKRHFHSQALRREFDNQVNKFAIKLLNGEEMVGHSPLEYSRIACYFFARGGLISVEVSGHCRRWPLLSDISSSRKAMLNELKALNEEGLIIM